MTRIRRDDTAGRTLGVLIFGILIISIAALIIGVIFVPHRIYYAAGILCGLISAICFVINMYDTISIVVDMNEKRAKRTAFARKSVRYIIMIMMLTISILLNVWMFLGAAIAFFSIKLSALLHMPLTGLFDKLTLEEESR